MVNPEESLQQRLLAHLRELVRDRDPFLATEGHFYTQHYLRQQWAQWGEVESFAFTVRGRTHQNWIINLPGTDAHRPPILLGAHYDTVPGSPGADDNATGLAALLELAEAIARQPLRYPVRLVAFDLEELGLLGSRAYAQHLRQQQQPLRLMLSLEMLGYCDRTPHSQRYPVPILKRIYPSQADFIALIGTWRVIPELLHFTRRISAAGQVSSQWLPAGNQGLFLPDVRRSDHAPFWDNGYRAILVTDTANLRNPHYHRESDRLETLDLAFFSGVVTGLTNALQTLH